jgi:hypothetical protein
MGNWRGIVASMALAGCYHYASYSHVAFGHKDTILAVDDSDGNCAAQKPPAGLEILDCTDRESRELAVGTTVAVILAVAIFVPASMYYVLSLQKH